jgi:DNA (cytosine-5)-methyltransferase 1
VSGLKQHYEEIGSEILRQVILGNTKCESRIRNIADHGQDAEGAWWQSVLRGERPRLETVRGKLSIVDSFCGSGGFALGAHLAAEALNFRTTFEAAIDTDEAAVEIHRHNLATKRPISDSVTRLVDYSVSGLGEGANFGYDPEIISQSLSSIRTTDLFIAGPPCQGHSNLNNHTRRQDPRNGLYVTSVALGVALKARAIIIENVPTVQNSHRDVVATSIGLLRNAGYAVTSAVLKADDFGAPQRRNRHFLVGILAGNFAESALSEFSEEQRRSGRPLSWAISDLVDLDGMTLWDQAPEPTPINRSRIDYLFDNDIYDLPDHQRPDCHKNGTTYTSVYGRMYWDRPAQTITTGIGTPGQGRYIHPTRRRVITPHEAARIQGFPDWFDFAPETVPLKRKNVAKWVGDAVHPVLGYMVGMFALRELKQAEVSQSIAA